MLGRGYPFNSSLYALHREKREYVLLDLYIVKYNTVLKCIYIGNPQGKSFKKGSRYEKTIFL